MKEKQQQLTFEKGITNIPSDFICSDNALQDCVGMTYADGEHKVIQSPALFMEGLSDTLLYVHEYNDEKRYIIKSGAVIKWGENNNGSFLLKNTLLTASGNTNVTSIGKTLVVTDGGGMHCYLWKSSSYESLIYPFEEIGIDVKMVSPSLGLTVGNSGKCDGIADVTLAPGDNDPTYFIVNGERDAYNNLVVGLYNKNLKGVATNKGFAKPFAVRAALELYDGSYTFITNPILLFPSVTMNSCAYFDGQTHALVTQAHNLFLITYFSKLYVRQIADYRGYKDIIKDVVLFATKGVDIYKTSCDQPLNYLGKDTNITVGDSVSAESAGVSDGSEYRTFTNSGGPNNFVFDCLEKRDSKDIKSDLESDTIFYKLCSLGLAPIGNYIDVASLAPDYVFENLTTQEQLGDDYYSRCSLTSDLTYAYNSRLNLANVSRGLFEGFGFFMPLDQNTDQVYDFYVKINLGVEYVWVANKGVQTRQKQGIYFFYPDSRAEEVRIFRWSDHACVCNASLKENETLNGAYFFRELPNSTTDEEVVSGISVPSFNNGKTELLPNYVIQSEVNNPFVYKASGYFKVGTGKIVAMSSTTQALSEGQFGQFPLLVFSESGIWALSVASTGYYSSVQPMSREVPLINNPCVTQTDGAVFFASKKGLMVVVGSQVKCVSTQLSGKDSSPFTTFLESATIAYDYRDSLLWIFRNDNVDAWVYSIKSGTFGHYHMTGSGGDVNVTNAYPDNLVQWGGNVYTLLYRPNINADQNTYSSTIVSRPMKLENSLTLKTIMQLKNIKQIQGNLTLTIEASNDIEHWVEITSLTGTPWKFYRFTYEFSNLKATDTFSGTILITQERRTNKLR